MEHPYEPSWGYQITGYFAPTSRFGMPDDFQFLVDQLHQNDIGVILDWVPSHFPEDAHGLGRFDGSSVYEHPDPRKGYHPDWKSLIFNYGRPEVRSFLISNALFWLDQYHADGLRVDAVASMLYLDYSRKYGEWESNQYGGNEYIEAIEFLKEFNTAVYHHYPTAQTIAEESTSFHKVSRPVHDGGLGFGYKWMMGWMNDTLRYFARNPVHRKHHQGEITFSMVYAFTENFMLPLSHDEVVYGKRSLLEKMPGDEWQQFANLRLLFTWMYLHPGAKLVFMGGEFAERREWDYRYSMSWHELEFESHRGIHNLMRSLNQLLRKEKALFQKNYEEDGFRWIEHDDSENSVISFIRQGNNEKDQLICLLNFTPAPRENYSIGVPLEGEYELIFNSDQNNYWGSGFQIPDRIHSYQQARHGFEQSINLIAPPLGAVVYKKC
jgi:1,4-alpha-glucan branching enzyme